MVILLDQDVHCTVLNHWLITCMYSCLACGYYLNMFFQMQLIISNNLGDTEV